MMILLPGAARADILFHAGQLICEGNRVLVRVRSGYVGEPPGQFPAIPAQITPFHALPVDGNTCTLEDGREVRVKLGFEQRWPYGMCGAGTNSFLSLWVGGKKVLSRKPACGRVFLMGMWI